MAGFLIGSDIYSLRKHLNKKKSFNEKPYIPSFSIVIPAHNESKTIIQCVASVVNNNYPQEKLEIVVVDDGSLDHTSNLLFDYKIKNKINNLKIIKQSNFGKAVALNNGIINETKGELVMCIDADSYLKNDAILKAAQYFKSNQVVAMAANLKIIYTGSLINLIQIYEYIIAYQMKRAQTLYNVEYIIGGIGSTFRRSILEKVKYYDTNTVTEDIDLTMKILRLGNKKFRVVYGADVLAYTSGVLTIKGLIAQRYRWKFGRTQTFLKNKLMFFNSDQKYTKGLTWFYLPFAVFSDLSFILEPILVSYIMYIVIVYSDWITLLSAFLVIFIYICINILAEDAISNKNKIKLLFLAPTMYFYFYILSFIEYIALVKALINFKNLKKSIVEGGCRWQHVDRMAINY